MLLAIFLPGLSLALNGRPASGLFWTLMQLTGIGWIIGIFVALSARSERRAVEQMRREFKEAVGQQGA